jgi:hypothetical protein
LGIINSFFHVDGAKKTSPQFVHIHRQVELRRRTHERGWSDKKDIHGLDRARRVSSVSPVAWVAVVERGGIRRAQNKERQQITREHEPTFCFLAHSTTSVRSSFSLIVTPEA